MIITQEFKRQKYDKEKYDMKQHVDVSCDECSKQYETTLRSQHIRFLKYSKDLCLSCAQKLAYENGVKTSHFREYNKSNLGKSYDERFGIDQSNKIKEKLSIATSGENNPMYGKNYQCHGLYKESQKRKGKTLIEIHGEEKAEEIRKKYSINSSGENNPMYGKPSPIGSGNGWSGWYNDIYFRSILELSYLVYLIDNNISFENGECRKFRIDYDMDDKKYTYFCDFVLSDGTYIEIKPKRLLNTLVNKSKFEASVNKLKDKFIVLTEDDVERLSFDMIKYYYDNNILKFIDRYDKKFKEMLNV